MKDNTVKNANTQICLVCGKRQKFYFRYRNYDYYLCADCGHITTYPFPTRREMKKYYQNKFKDGNYHLVRKYSEEYKVIYRQFVKLLCNEFTNMKKTVQGKKILDVGCFTGDFLVLMKEIGADVYGLELQDDAVEIANKKLSGRVKSADVMTSTFPNLDFDIITLLGIVEHVTDPIKLIRRSTDLLKKGGILMIQTPNSGSKLSKWTKQYWPPFAPVEHIHLFSKNSLVKSLELCGYENITYSIHIKKLPLGYVYNQFKNFGPEYYRLLRPLDSIITKFSSVTLPLYGGEMIMIAQKK